MIRANWMWRNAHHIRQFELNNIVEELNDAGYYSCLFTVHSKTSDYIPKIAKSFDLKHKIKYMLAIRPYLLSPQYLMMLLAGFQDMAPDRIMINWVHGHIANDENFNGIIDNGHDFADIDVRRSYMEKFITMCMDPKITGMYQEIKFPESLISGGNIEIVKMAKKLNLSFATAYDVFLQKWENEYKQFNLNSIFVQLSVLVRETDDEAKKDFQNLVPDSMKQNSILYGSYETLKNKILQLDQMGVTDILVGQAYVSDKQERQTIHNFINRLRSEKVIL